MEAYNKEIKTICSGSWLKLEQLVYSDNHGITRNWETATRIKGRGAVAIIAMLEPSDRIILIRQYRPPAEGYVIEFPAGLIDEGETPEQTAVRELREETGYTGTVNSILPPSFSSPGLSGEQVNLVFMTVEENSEHNELLETSFDDGEHVETLTVSLSQLDSFLDEQCKTGDLMDAKVLAFAQGWKFCRHNK